MNIGGAIDTYLHIKTQTPKDKIINALKALPQFMEKTLTLQDYSTIDSTEGRI